MHHKLTAIATTGVLVTSFVFAPLSAVMAKPTSNSLPNTFLLAKSENKLLKNVPFSLSESGYTIVGKVSITEFDYTEEEGLLASGTIKGEYTGSDGTTTEFNEAFTDIPTTLSQSGTKQLSCDILFLDLGPIFLDVLGLTVDLSPITLDIDAVPGSGNLLGNLLCSLVGLLDGAGTLAQILNIIEQINNLLG